MIEAKVKAPAGTQAALRAIRVLKAFSTERPELTLTEMCGAVGLTKTTTHRLLNALMSEGLVERDSRSGRYRLGIGILALATSMISGRTLISAVQRLEAGQQRLVIRQVESLVQAFHEEANSCEAAEGAKAESR